MIFNYLMVSALASATDYIERNGIKPTGGQFLMKVNFTQKSAVVVRTPIPAMLVIVFFSIWPEGHIFIPVSPHKIILFPYEWNTIFSSHTVCPYSPPLTHLTLYIRNLFLYIFLFLCF
jgi:hypothetical protein